MTTMAFRRESIRPMPARLSYFLSLIVVLTGTPRLTVGKEQMCSLPDIHAVVPPVDATPAVEVTEVSPANCSTRSDKGTSWITVASTIRTSLSPEAVLQRFGAISELQTVQYWSTTDEAWRPMISAAFAVSAADSDQPRKDFASTEIVGSLRFYRVTDTRTYRPVHYSLEIHPAAHGEIIAETTNVDPIKKWGISLYRPDGLHTLYFLNGRSPGIWSYYSITRAVPATFLARGREKSYVNRAIALYRHYMLLPTTAEPPAAR